MNKDDLITELAELLAETQDLLSVLDTQKNWPAMNHRLQSLIKRLHDISMTAEIVPITQLADALALAEALALALSLTTAEKSSQPEVTENITTDLHCLEIALRSTLKTLTRQTDNQHGYGYSSAQKTLNTLEQPSNILLLSTDPELICAHTQVNSPKGEVPSVTSNLNEALDRLHSFPTDVFIIDLQSIDIEAAKITALINEKRNSEHTQLLLLASENDLGKLQKLRPLSWECLLIKPVQASLLQASVDNLVQQASNFHVNKPQVSKEQFLHYAEIEALNQHAIVSIADIKGKITYCNDLFCLTSGYQPSELLGNSHRLLKSEVHPDALYRDLWRTITSGNVWKGEICNRSKDGNLYWVASTIVPFLDNNGRPYQYVSIRTDITETKQLQLKAKQSDERLRLSQEFANIGTWEWNIGTNELYWSECIAPLFGYTQRELETSYENFLNAVHPNDRSLVENGIKNCIEQGNEYRVEHRVIWPDGQVRWVFERGDATRDEQGKPLKMLGIVIDIHDRKMAEQAKHESEKKFRNLFSRSPAGIMLCDINGTLLEVNQSLLDITGYTQDEFYAQNKHNSLLHQLPDLSGLRLLEQHRIVNKQGPVESKLHHKDGHLLALLLNFSLIPDESGKPLISIIIQDQTKSKQEHQELMIFRRIFESTQQPIGIADTKGELIFFNQPYQELHGLTKEALTGQSITNFFVSESSSAPTDEIMTALTLGKGWSGLLPIERGHGASLMTDNNFGTISGPDGSVQFLFNIARDYSEEIMNQEKLINAKSIAERASLAKSEFLSSMSHELRTPMNAILGFAQLLEYDDDLSGDQQDNVNEISKAGQHLLTLINEILDLAKIESGHASLSVESVQVGDLLSECITLLTPVAQQREITLHLKAENDYHVQADRTRFKQILLNLLSNAIKYNQEKGTVIVDLTPVDEDALRITVSDTGYGLSREQLDNLFQPFNRLGAEGSDIEGSGIGLAITQRLIKMMKGHIGVESKEGVGSRFWLELPRELLATQADNTAATDDSAAVSNACLTPNLNHQVLYIEDNPANLRLVTQILSKRQHIDLITAHEPALGLELASSHQPDLILLDINMPGLDGYQVLSRLRSNLQLKHIPVIAVSAAAMPRDIAKGKEAGFSDYLTKPLDVGKLLTTLDYYLTECEPNKSRNENE